MSKAANVLKLYEDDTANIEKQIDDLRKKAGVHKITKGNPHYDEYQKLRSQLLKDETPNKGKSGALASPKAEPKSDKPASAQPKDDQAANDAKAKHKEIDTRLEDIHNKLGNLKDASDPHVKALADKYKEEQKQLHKNKVDITPLDDFASKYSKIKRNSNGDVFDPYEDALQDKIKSQVVMKYSKEAPGDDKLNAYRQDLAHRLLMATDDHEKEAYVNALKDSHNNAKHTDKHAQDNWTEDDEDMLGTSIGDLDYAKKQLATAKNPKDKQKWEDEIEEITNFIDKLNAKKGKHEGLAAQVLEAAVNVDPVAVSTGPMAGDKVSYQGADYVINGYDNDECELRATDNTLTKVKRPEGKQWLDLFVNDAPKLESSPVHMEKTIRDKADRKIADLKKLRDRAAQSSKSTEDIRAELDKLKQMIKRVKDDRDKEIENLHK